MTEMPLHEGGLAIGCRGQASVDSEAGEVFPNADCKSSCSLEEIARTLRRHIVTMIAAAGSGHPGGSLSAVEIVTVLFFRLMRHRSYDPNWKQRDHFILSKGHAAPLLYAALAESGYFPTKELITLRKIDSRLQGHTDRAMVPGVESTAGSLGQGLSFAIGVALACKLDSLDSRIYTLLGDGECDEGQIWEAAMAAPHYHLDNLTAIVDRNNQQIDGWTRDVMNTEPLGEKWHSFGWHVIEVDGHDIGQLLSAFEEAKQIKDKSSVIIAHTIKGKGVSFMENNLKFHGTAPTQEQLEIALRELA